MSLSYLGHATNCNSYIQLTQPTSSSGGSVILNNGCSQGGFLARYYVDFSSENPLDLTFSFIGGSNTFTSQMNSNSTRMLLNGNVYASCNLVFPNTSLNSSNLFVIKQKFNPLQTSLYVNNNLVINYSGSNAYTVSSNSQFIWNCSNITGTTTQKRLINPTIQNIMSFSNAVEVTNSLKANVMTTSNMLINGELDVTFGNFIDFGHGKSNRETNAGKIGYESFGSSYLHIVGAGTAYLNRNVKIWDNIDVEGSVKEGGSLLSSKYALSNILSNLAVGTHNHDTTYLKMSGGSITGAVQMSNTNYIEFGFGKTKQTDAGKITYGNWTADTLEIVGGHASSASERVVKLYDKLVVSSGVYGGLKIGDFGYGSTWQGISHSNLSGSSYALLHSSTGDTYINSATNKSIEFRNNNTNIATIFSSGRTTFGNHTASLNSINSKFTINTYPGSLHGLLVWNSNQGGFCVQEDRNMVVYNQNGSVLWTANTATSDRRFKKNISKIDGALDKLCQLEGVQFEYLDEENIEKGKKIGFIADDLKQVFPEAVKEFRNAFDSNISNHIIDYSKLTSVLVEAIKELRQEVKALKKELK